MAQRVRARSGKGQRNGMNIDHGVDLCPHVGQNDDQQQNQPQGNGIEQLSRQIAAALIECNIYTLQVGGVMNMMKMLKPALRILLEFLKGIDLLLRLERVFDYYKVSEEMVKLVSV
nr:hypothetical protein CFP56_54053 [Quercus suber]